MGIEYNVGILGGQDVSSQDLINHDKARIKREQERATNLVSGAMNSVPREQAINVMPREKDKNMAKFMIDGHVINIHGDTMRIGCHQMKIELWRTLTDVQADLIGPDFLALWKKWRRVLFMYVYVRDNDD